MFWKKKKKEEEEEEPGVIFNWITCDTCEETSCKLPDATVYIVPIKSRIPPYEMVEWVWTIHIERGYPRDITIKGRMKTEATAKFMAMEAYCKWKGLI